MRKIYQNSVVGIILAMVVTTIASGTNTAIAANELRIVAQESTSKSDSITQLYLEVGGKQDLKFLGAPSTWKKLNPTWTSSNKNIATVDKNGVVTGIAVGKATITFSLSNQMTGEVEVTVGIKPLNKTMYVSSGVNVRSGHSTDYDKIGSLNKGEEVKVIGQSEKTGWYLINYNGKDGYVSKNYLQDEPLLKEVPTQKIDNIENILNNAVLNPRTSNYEPLNEEIDKLFGEILTDTMTTYQKVKTCYDYLINHCSYGMNEAMDIWALFFGYEDEARAYGMLVGHIGVCDDYSATFAMLMQAIGLDCYVVGGQTSKAGGGYTGHAWCEMVIDEIVYVFDPQVEDNIAKGGTINYYRFGKTYEQVPEKYIKEIETNIIETVIEGKEGNFEYIIQN